MANERFPAAGRQTGHAERVEPSPRCGNRSLVWILWIVPFLAFVALPVVFSGDFALWREVPVSDPFGVTPALVVLEATGTSAKVEFHVDVGHFGTQNVYQHHFCNPQWWDLNPDGTVSAQVSETNDCSLGFEFSETAGWCCASEEGWGQDGVISWAATGPGFTLTEAKVQATPTPVITTTEIANTVNLVSATMGRWYGGFAVTAYDLANIAVNIYTSPEVGDWSYVTSVTCDSPYDNYHWSAATDPSGSKLWVACRNSGPVQVTQVDLGTGAHDWSQQIDSVPASSDFYYQQCDSCGVAGAGPALACISPSPNGTEVCMMGQVGDPSPPTSLQCTSFPDAAKDRQVFECDGGMIFSHGADPDGSGALSRFLNCGDLDGPCIQMTHEDNSRGVTFAGAPPQDLWIPVATPAARPIRYNRLPVVEGYNPPGQVSDVVRFGALTVPSFFDNFEGGDARLWSNGGGSKTTPPP
ncbi:MAG: hypothetical protein GY906_18405 [bacterium]|nr:hypothetical protein [bacterium]